MDGIWNIEQELNKRIIFGNFLEKVFWTPPPHKKMYKKNSMMDKLQTKIV